MSLDAWIIDELEDERREEEGKGEQPGLGIRSPLEGESSDARRPARKRGIRILDISPAMENVIDL